MLLGFRVPLPFISTVYIMAKVNPIPAPQSDLQSEEITVSPFLLWFIVSIAAVFFVSGILHILHRFFKKKNPNYHQSVLSHSNRYSELLGPQSLGRQLQQLFRLQDSGLDQSLIDNLPVFSYNDIITDSKLHPFDCAVCLCEFLPHDKLRLIPICSHGFHTHCIDTWLLSNSTCPLCRVNLGVELRSCNNGGLRENAVNVPTNNVERVLSVRLGKLESFNGEGRLNGDGGEGSGCNLDSRRCFSMGSFRYVVNDKDLEVALFNGKKDDVGCGKSEEDD